MADYFESVAAQADAKSAADWVLNRRPAPVDTVAPQTLAALIGLVAEGTITNTIAQARCTSCWSSSRTPTRPSWSSATGWHRSATAPSWRRWWTR